MRKVTVRQLQAHISEELRALPFLITRRGKPAAIVRGPAQVPDGAVITGEGSAEGMLASKDLTKEQKRVALRRIIENPKARDADRVKAVAEGNRLDTSMNDTGDKPDKLTGDYSAEEYKGFLKTYQEAKADFDRTIGENVVKMGEGVTAQTFETTSGRTVGVLYVLPSGEFPPDSWIECAEDGGPGHGDLYSWRANAPV